MVERIRTVSLTQIDVVIGDVSYFDTAVKFDWAECMWGMSLGTKNAGYLRFYIPKWEELVGLGVSEYDNEFMHFNPTAVNQDATQTLRRGLYMAHRLKSGS